MKTFLEITMLLGRKIVKTKTDSKRRPFSTLEKNFSLSIFDCGCMPPPFKNSIARKRKKCCYGWMINNAQYDYVRG